MAINFESTITEADFKRPLLDTNEERMVRELHGEPDLSVDGLSRSLMSQLVNLFGAGRR